MEGLAEGRRSLPARAKPWSMRILVDADAMPGDVKRLMFRAAERESVALLLVANVPLRHPEGPLFSSVVVDGGFNAADDWLAEQAGPGDLVVTADVPLAGRVVARGALALDPRGGVYNSENVLRILEDPKLFRKLAQIIVRVLRRQMVRQLSANRKELLDVVKPGILMTQHSFSSDLSFHPHWHIIVSDGVFTPEGDFIPLWHWDTQALLEDLRASILRAFVRWSKLSPETARSLQEWELERSGFSCFLSPAIPEDDKEGLGRLVRYLFRSPVSYRQLSYDEGTGMVRCRSKRGGYREWHATEFLAVLAQHVPRPRQHVVTYAGHYANAAGNLNHESEDDTSDGETKENAGGFRRYSWAELLALVWRVDPLECPRCGEQMVRGRTMRGEELREFLKSINRLGYPPRPPPVSPGGRGWPQESLEDPFIEPDSAQFIDDTSQVPPDWES